jgi:hypothetical protein
MTKFITVLNKQHPRLNKKSTTTKAEAKKRSKNSEIVNDRSLVEARNESKATSRNSLRQLVTNMAVGTDRSYQGVPRPGMQHGSIATSSIPMGTLPHAPLRIEG